MIPLEGVVPGLGEHRRPQAIQVRCRRSHRAVAVLARRARAPRRAPPTRAGHWPPAPAPAAKTGGSSTPAKAKTPSPHVTSVRIASVSCVPVAHCSGNPHQVSSHGTLLLGASASRPGMTVAFPRSPGARISRVSTTAQPAAHLRYAIPGKPSAGLLVTVPKSAHSGHIMILLSGGRYTSSYGPIYVYDHALHPPPPPPKDPPPASAGAVSASAFEGQGMWIWYLSKSDGGSVAVDRRAGARGRRDHAVHQELRRLDQLLEPVLAAAGRRTARQRLESVRLAVRVRDRTSRRGRARRRGGRRRRRMPGDRRRERVRRPLRGRADLHRRPAREDRPRIPPRAGLLPVRLRPPLLPLLGVPRPRRRAVQRAADVLEGHRPVGRHRLRQHIHRQPHLRAPDLPARTDLRRRLRRPNCCASARRPSTTAPPVCPSGTGRKAAPATGARSPRRSRR